MLEAIGLEILKKAVPEIVKKIGGNVEKAYHNLEAKVKNACHQYEKKYKERHGQLKVFCVGMREPIPLDDVYVAVQFLDQDSKLTYKSLDDIEMAFRARNKNIVEFDPIKRQSGTRVAKDKQFLMVLGAPGVGKSTFLRKIGLEALKGKNGNFAHKCIPIFLELKRFTEKQINIEDMIINELKVCGYPHPDQLAKTALVSGKFLVLLDGLDEVPRANVSSVIDKIGDFVDQYSQNRFIASCRIAAYKGGFTRFTEVEIADFDDCQIKSYINNWFASTPDQRRRQLDEDMKIAKQCWKTLNAPEHQATKELAQNPLLLTLLCMVYDNSQNLPRNRADLYDKALTVFLEEWSAEKRIPRGKSVDQYLDIAEQKRMLSEIAAKNFENDHLFFPENELIDQIQEFGEGNANTPPIFDARKILETILVDQGLFVERAKDIYSFSHLTFQEYLTANYIVGNTSSIQELVIQYLHDERWREVFLLTAGRMREADRLIENMTIKANKSINTHRVKELLRWAKHITNTIDSSYDGVAKRAFAIRQYFSLWWLNKIRENIENIANQPSDSNASGNLDQERIVFLNTDLNQYRSLYQDIDHDLYQSLDFEVEFGRNRAFGSDVNFYQDLYFDPNLHFKLFVNNFRDIYMKRYPELYPELNLYQNLSRYLNTNFYPPIFSSICDNYEGELGDRITVAERMEHEKIFNMVNFQQTINQYNEHQKFIIAAKKGKSIQPPEAYIHDTWISVLRITDDMLAMSVDEIESYIRYLRAVHLIVKCKEAAGRVSSDVWQQIEDRLLAWNIED